nr:MAG TPA: hypothetical protein [Caudoviricetes sp.]
MIPAFYYAPAPTLSSCWRPLSHKRAARRNTCAFFLVHFVRRV